LNFTELRTDSDRACGYPEHDLTGNFTGARRRGRSEINSKVSMVWSVSRRRVFPRHVGRGRARPVHGVVSGASEGKGGSCSCHAAWLTTWLMQIQPRFVG